MYILKTNELMRMPVIIYYHKLKLLKKINQFIYEIIMATFGDSQQYIKSSVEPPVE